MKAVNYASAINRALGAWLQSPGFRFVADENATNIAGALAVRDGQASKAFGVKARGNKLSVTLTKQDATFLAKISWAQPANELFFSDRVDMRSFVYQPIYETPPFNALALK